MASWVIFSSIILLDLSHWTASFSLMNIDSHQGKKDESVESKRHPSRGRDKHQIVNYINHKKNAWVWKEK